MDTEKNVYVLGCGGHAVVVIHTLRALGYQIAGLFDDDTTKCTQNFEGVHVVGPLDSVLRYPRCPAVIAVGDNSTRAEIAKRLQLDWLTAVHPRAYVDPTATLGPGTVVFAGAVVQPKAQIGSHGIINTSATVDHECLLGDFVHLAPGTQLAGGVSVGERTLMGIGSVVIPERKIGADAVVGAGAVVIGDIPSGVTAVGVPARVLVKGNPSA